MTSVLQKILGNDELNVNVQEIEQRLNNCSTMRTEIEFVEGGSNPFSGLLKVFSQRHEKRTHFIFMS